MAAPVVCKNKQRVLRASPVCHCSAFPGKAVSTPFPFARLRNGQLLDLRPPHPSASVARGSPPGAECRQPVARRFLRLPASPCALLPRLQEVHPRMLLRPAIEPPLPQLP